MFKDIEAVIFDLDGTLVSVEERFYRVFLDTLKAYRLPPVEREPFMEKFRTNRLDDLVELEDKHKFWITFLNSYSGAHEKFSDAFPGTREAIRILKGSGVKIGLITGRLCEPEDVLAELRERGLSDLIDAIVTKKLVLAQLKPAELFSRSLEIIQLLEMLKVNPQKSVLVADYVADMESAKGLGLKAVAVLSGSSDQESLVRAAPDIIIKSVAELPTLFGLTGPKAQYRR